MQSMELNVESFPEIANILKDQPRQFHKYKAELSTENGLCQSMMFTTIPSLPFDIVGMDVFEFGLPKGGYIQKKRFLITVTSVTQYLDFFEVDKSAVVEICKRNLVRHAVFQN